MTHFPAEPIQSQTLGTFLRSHRERLSPTKLGLPSAGRRRTPGLRREEVAQLCGVSTTWYTWLEQGRPVRASASVLRRIAEALQLSRAERVYLFEIARCVVPDSSEAYALEIPTGLKDLVDRMPVPVYVLDRQWNAVAWNGRAARLFRPWLFESEERNLLRFVFLNRNARTLIVDWRSRAKRLVAEFRSDAGRHLTEPPTLRLISGLQGGSRVFAKLERTGCAGTRGWCSYILFHNGSDQYLFPGVVDSQYQYRSQARRAHSATCTFLIGFERSGWRG